MQNYNQQFLSLIIASTGIIFILAALIITLLLIYRKRQLTYQLNVQSLRLHYEKDLLKTQNEIQEQTLLNISREIHDNINLSLTLAKLNLNTLNLNDLEKSSSSINSTVGLLTGAIANLRDLSKSMNPQFISSLGLLNAVENEVARIKEFAHLDIFYSVKGEPVFLEAEKELIIFRMIQEAFNNILKHAKGTKVLLELNYQKEYLDIIISDNGIGFPDTGNPSQSKNKSGLLNMKMRSQMLGGSFNIKSQPNNGTELSISIPF